MGEVLGGRYELVDPLGEGGAGVVWRAWDHRESRYVAAKVMRQSDAASLLRFVREQAVRVEHPHVLTPLGWAGEDGRVLFTMPVVRGGSAATLVGDHGPLPVAWVAVLLDQLLQALERIHAEGLVHRDVKPANLLLDATGRGVPRMRLADFGIATTLDQPRLTHVSHVVGTRGYAAPETFAPGWDPDPRADLYAAGMTAAELLLGERPDGASPDGGQGTGGGGDRVGGRDRAGDLAAALIRAQVPVGLAGLVLALTAPDPADRPADATTALAALRATGLAGMPSADMPRGGQDAGGVWDPGDVEVFDQVPPLPDGWTDHGPDTPTPTPAPAPSPPSASSGALSTPPSASSGGLSTPPSASSGGLSTPPSASSGGVSTPPSASSGGVSTPPSAPSGDAPEGRAVPRGREGTALGVVLLVAGLLLVLAAVLVAVL